jgi:predicted dehydrogenase
MAAYEAEELAALAKEKGIRTVVGMQARADPLVVKVKELVETGKIGKVISSSVVGAFAGYPPAWPETARSHLDINSGGNNLTVSFGHCKFTSASFTSSNNEVLMLITSP